MKCLIETPSQELLQNVQIVAAQHKSCGVPSAHSFCLSKALIAVFHHSHYCSPYLLLFLLFFPLVFLVLDFGIVLGTRSLLGVLHSVAEDKVACIKTNLEKHPKTSGFVQL